MPDYKSVLKESRTTVQKNTKTIGVDWALLWKMGNAWGLSQKYKLPLLFASVILPLVISFKITYLSPSQTQYLVETEINDEKQKFIAFHKMTWQNKSMKKHSETTAPRCSEKMYSFLQIPSEIKKKFIAPFYGWGSTASRLEPLGGGSLLFTTNFP